MGGAGGRHHIAASCRESRVYDLDVEGDGPHTLVLATSRTLQPRAMRFSRDRRELGVSLRRLVWLPRDCRRARLARAG